MVGAPPHEVRFDYDLVLKLTRARVFPEHFRLEAIDGRLVAMPADGDLHQYIMHRLTRAFAATEPRLPKDLIWLVNATLRFADGDVLQPDFLFGAPPSLEASYTPDKAKLVVEVAHSTLAYDRGAKRARYARGGLAEHWLIEAEAKQVQVSRAPVDGDWTEVFVRRPGERVAFGFAPELDFDPADFF